MNYSFSDHANQVQGSAIRELIGLLGDPNMISFAGGNPSPVTFPKEILAEISAESILNNGDSLLQYGMTEGQKSLVESCAALNQRRHLSTSLDHILPTSGATQAIDLMTKIFVNDGDTILCESPTFLGALQTFHMYGANIVGVNSHPDGHMDLQDLEEKLKTLKPKFLYVIPNFQNPSGRTWGEQERRDVLRLAQQYQTLILEDDPYGELRYTGEPILPIYAMDDQEIVIHLSSFSKTICPGLRVGYATASPTIIKKMAVGKQGSDLMTSSISQRMIDGFLRSGRYEEHVANNCQFYQAQMAAMLEAIDQLFPKEAIIHAPEGGLFLWVTLPEYIDATALLQQAIERGVGYVPGEHFYPNTPQKNTLRLNFSLETIPNIRTGVERLAPLLNEVIHS